MKYHLFKKFFGKLVKKASTYCPLASILTVFYKNSIDFFRSIKDFINLKAIICNYQKTNVMYQSSDDTQNYFDVVTFLFSMNLCRGQNERKLMLKWTLQKSVCKTEISTHY